MKYIVVTGGVLSGLGKGITTSSIGRLLKARGLNVTVIKIDPYLNCDAGTMNPFEHGEVFVLNDGGEVDLDLGNYERFLDMEATIDNNITTGKVFRKVIEKERRGDYLGKTVQIIPHVTNEIRDWVRRVAREQKADVAIVEVGGTVGDIESAPFLEALRQLRIAEGYENVAFVHTTLVPVLGVVGEQKTKPTQHSVKELRAIGIEPDMLVCRTQGPLEQKTREKLSLFSDVPVEAVISARDVRSIYEVPLLFEEQGVADQLLRRLGVTARAATDLEGWRTFVQRILKPDATVDIAVVGKYTDLGDSYLSITEAFHHAGAAESAKVNVHFLESTDFDADDRTIAAKLKGMDGILVPGGFGARGSEGKIKAVRCAREEGIPYLGICFGFQLAVIEFARHVCGLAKANSTELDASTPHPVVDILPEQKTIVAKGGTMRLGGSEIVVTRDTLAHRLYGSDVAVERHRHRFEVNPDYIERLEGAGLVFSGRNPKAPLMEIAEIPGHPFFVGGQFHPEFRSRPGRPAPLFHGFVRAALERRKARAATGST